MYYNTCTQDTSFPRYSSLPPRVDASSELRLSRIALREKIHWVDSLSEYLAFPKMNILLLVTFTQKVSHFYHFARRRRS